MGRKSKKLCIKCNKGESATGKRPYCKPCRNAMERASYNPQKDRDRHLKYFYGITREEYNNILLKQKNRCAICRKEFKKWHVDHNHKTGKVRGVLCVRCNLSVGFIENEAWKLKAFKYLAKNK